MTSYECSGALLRRPDDIVDIHSDHSVFHKQPVVGTPNGLRRNAFELFGIIFFSFLFEFRPLLCTVSLVRRCSCPVAAAACRRHRRHRRIRSLPLADRPAVTLSPFVRPSTPPRAPTALYTCSPVPVSRDRVSNPNRQSDPAFLVSRYRIRFAAAEELYCRCLSNSALSTHRYHVPLPLRSHARRTHIVGVTHENPSKTSSAGRFARASHRPP